MPCMSLIWLERAFVTIWCCFTILTPLKSGASTYTSYMEPQPPEMSTTAISVAVGNEAARAEMRDSSAGDGASHSGGEVWRWLGDTWSWGPGRWGCRVRLWWTIVEIVLTLLKSDLICPELINTEEIRCRKFPKHFGKNFTAADIIERSDLHQQFRFFNCSWISGFQSFLIFFKNLLFCLGSIIWREGEIITRTPPQYIRGPNQSDIKVPERHHRTGKYRKLRRWDKLAVWRAICRQNLELRLHWWYWSCRRMWHRREALIQNWSNTKSKKYAIKTLWVNYFRF